MMDDDDYFYDSVPDGISNAIYEFDDDIECCNQDSYELLLKTFDDKLCGDALKSATDEEYAKFAQAMKDYFELSYLPTGEDAKKIIRQALNQWGG